MKIFTTDSLTITTPMNTSSATSTNPSGASGSYPSFTSSMRRLKAMEAMAVASGQTALPPVCTVDFRNPTIHANHAQIESEGAFYNRAYGNSWLMHYPGKSYIQVQADFQKDPSRSYSLDLVHLSSLVDGKPLASITIEVNGHTVIAEYNPNTGDYKRDSFDITKYLVDGKNTVTLKFDNGSESNYWIQSLAIQAK